MLGIVVDILLVAVILFLLYCLSAIWPPDSPWAPWWQTPKDVIRAMLKLAKVGEKDVVYDLGCGTGEALITAAKECGATGVGVEIDPLRAALAKVNIWRQKAPGIVIRQENFFSVPLQPATVVVMYLIPNALKRLVPKFLKEVKPGTRFISYRYEMPLKLFKGRLKLVNHDAKHEIFIYTMTA